MSRCIKYISKVFFMNNHFFQDEFLPEYATFEEEKLRFGKSIVINRAVFPFKVKYLPFFEQLTTQLSLLLKKYTKKNFVKYFDFTFKVSGRRYEGEPFVIKQIIKGPIKDDVFNMKYTEYRGEFHKLHKDGYAYGRFSMHSKVGLCESVDIWFRWKSNVLGYDYIEPDDELYLNSNDITFEICKEIPKEYVEHFYAKNSEEYDCKKWIEVINDENNYPKKRSKKINTIQYEMSKNCKYPDVVFNVFMNEKITKSICDDLMSELTSFQLEWDANHIYGIHDMGLQSQNNDKKNDYLIRINIDFGSCEDKIIKHLVKWLEKSNLNIKNIFIE